MVVVFQRPSSTALLVETLPSSLGVITFRHPPAGGERLPSFAPSSPFAASLSPSVPLAAQPMLSLSSSLPSPCGSPQPAHACSCKSYLLIFDRRSGTCACQSFSPDGICATNVAARVAFASTESSQ